MLKYILLKYTMIMGLTIIFCYISHKFECWNVIIIYLLVLNLTESKGE